MSAIVFWLLIVSLSWLVGYMQGKGHGLLEGRALRELQMAYERPMVRRKR